MNFSDQINSLLLDDFSGAASFRPFSPCTGGTTTCPGTTPAAPTCSWWPAGPAPDAPRRPLWWPARPPSYAQSGRRRRLAALLCQRRRRHTASCCQTTARSRRPTRNWIYAAKFRHERSSYSHLGEYSPKMGASESLGPFLELVLEAKSRLSHGQRWRTPVKGKLLALQ